jgi:hypothetical protein
MIELLQIIIGLWATTKTFIVGSAIGVGVAKAGMAGVGVAKAGMTANFIGVAKAGVAVAETKAGVSGILIGGSMPVIINPPFSPKEINDTKEVIKMVWKSLTDNYKPIMAAWGISAVTQDIAKNSKEVNATMADNELLSLIKHVCTVTGHPLSEWKIGVRIPRLKKYLNSQNITHNFDYTCDDGTEFVCPICNDDNGIKHVCVTNCGHTVCAVCLKTQLIFNVMIKNEPSANIKCCMCREIITP